jgi:hypothetical protein
MLDGLRRGLTERWYPSVGRAERFSHSVETGSIRAYRIRAESVDIMGCKDSFGLITA